MNEENSVKLSSRLPYVAPCVNAWYVELEYAVAAGSVNGSMTESWETETQSQDLKW